MNRRELIQQLGLTGAAALAAPLLPAALPASASRVLRIAHITDVHIQPEKGAPKGFEQCLAHIQSLSDPVDVIFNGGDSIMDSLNKDKQRVTLQWNLWKSILQQNCSLEMVHCIGNHDVWGIGPKGDPFAEKGWALDAFGLDMPYYSFDRAGWHFIVLDGTQPRDGKWYTARLDETQMAWLKEDLRRTPAGQPILVLSHIPIFSAAAFMDGDNEKTGDWTVPGAWMHIDAREIIELFYRHKNVKCCISGHLHLVDRVDYNEVTYYCNGAVSGSWWGEKPYHQTPAGYAVLNLYADGSVEREYIYYGLYD